MLRTGNGRRGVAASLCMPAAIALISLAHAQQAVETPPLPEARGVVEAYMRLSEWVRTYDVPAPDEEAARIAIANAGGACVQLRRRGRVLGIGVEMGGDDLTVRRAAGRAMAAVRGDRAVAALPEEMKGRIGTTLTVELDVAGPLIPLPGRSFARVAEQIEPGLDGVALRRGEAVIARFPAQMLAANTAGDVERLLPALAVELGLPARPLAELRRQFDVRVYRFRTTHLVQRAPGRAPFEAFRGQRLVNDEDVTEQAIASFAASLVDHVLTTFWTGDPTDEDEPTQPLGMMGDYLPVADRYEPLIAPPRDQALLAFALARYAQAPQVAPDEVKRARSAARVVLRELAAVAPGEIDPLTDPSACAAIVFADSVLPSTGQADDPALREFLDGATERVGSSYREEAGFAFPVGPDGALAPIDAHGQAMLAAAMARIQRQSGRPDHLPRVRQAIDRAWQAAPGAERLALLPWIGWAEADYAAATGAAMGRVEDLKALTAILEAMRIESAALPGPRDLQGGFALVGGRGACADAQSTRPAAWLASIIRDPALTTPGDAHAAMGGHLRTMRFLMQLAVDDTMLWAIRNPTRALGGLRAATWDVNQPAAAQAMALLTAAETLLSLDQLPAGTENQGPRKR